MELETILLRTAGAVQLVIAGANFVLPARLEYEKNLAPASLIVRQIFLVHGFYIVLVVTALGLLCVAAPHELLADGRLAHYLRCFIALFWTLRIPIQLGYYDPEVRRRNRVEDVLFASALIGVAATTSWLAWSHR